MNAEAAFYGADGDAPGLGSIGVIRTQSGAMAADMAKHADRFATVLDAVGLDSWAQSQRQRAGQWRARSSQQAPVFAREQERRRAAVAALPKAQGLTEKVADLTGRFTAGIPQPENFIGIGPGMAVSNKLLPRVAAAAGGGALGNLAVEPITQADAIARGTRKEYSATDAAINAGVGAVTGGVLGGAAHGVELGVDQLRGRSVAPPADVPAPPPGFTVDAAPPGGASAASRPAAASVGRSVGEVTGAPDATIAPRGPIRTRVAQADSIVPDVPTRAPHTRYTPSPLPPLSGENYAGKLSRYAPTMWRETNLDALDEVLPTSRTSAATLGQYRELYLSNDPNLARDQQDNRGVMLEFDASALDGRVSTDKPGWDFGWQQGGGEFVTRNMGQGAVQHAVRSVTVTPDAVASSKVLSSRARMALNDLETHGWTKHANDDGSITYRRPDQLPSARPARTAILRQPRERVAPAPQPLPAGFERRPVLRGRAHVRDASGRPLSTERIQLSAPPEMPIPAPPAGFTVDERQAGSDLGAPPPPPGFTVDAQPAGFIRPLVEQTADVTSEKSVSETLKDMIAPGDVVPLRGPRARPVDNRLGSLEEAEQANPSSLELIQSPNERDALTRRQVGRTARTGPADLVTWLRSQGGVRESGGELRHFGIDNKPRALDFARDEGFVGRLVSDDGMDLDTAAQAAWEAGYFPDHTERPPVSEFLDALGATHSGRARTWHPDDFDELDAFYGAQGERSRIEGKAQDGAPLARLRGEPITMDDLDARLPPAEAYRIDIPMAPETAGNIRLDLLDSPESINRALNTVAARARGFVEARRGVMRQDQTRALAADLGMTADDLLRRRRGQALNAEQALAARQLLAKSGNELVALAKRTVGGSDEDLARFRAALSHHVAIQEQVSGAAAEAGRALAQFRMIANSRDVQGPVIRGEAVRAVIDGAGGRDHLEDVARKLVEAGDTPAKLNKLAQAAAKPGGREKFMELYINSLLSGPQTHAVNILSNAITAIGQVPETLGAAAFGAMRRSDPDRVLFSEAGARAEGLIQGAREGLKLARTAFRTGNPSDFVGAIENSQYRAISGRKGDLVRLPTRALTAEDEFFKAVAKRMELNALAVRKSAASGLTGKARRDMAANLAANPTDDMLLQARDYARYLTFQRQLGTFGQRALAVTSAPTTKGAIAKWLFPFIRTPANLMKFAVERSPLAPLLRGWRADYTAGGARRDTALARFTFGSGLAALVATWAAEGTITGGGPSDPEQRALLMADGWRPYSVRIGDTFYSYERLDPLAKVLATVADLVEHSNGASERDADEVGGAVVASIVSNLAGSIFLDTMGDLATAIEDPKRGRQQFLASQAGKLVPAAVGQIAQTIDPVMREAKTPLDRIKSRVPGLSTGLLPKRDIWGQPISRPERLGPDLASPLPVGKALNDPVNRELIRLGVQVGRLQRKIGDFNLNAVEYDAYQATAGALSRQYVEAEIRNDWRSLSEADLIEALRTAIKDAREDARDLMRQRFPHLEPVE